MAFKPVSDDIFSLVKALTEVEGRYFIQHLNRMRINQRDSYINLFKLLSSLDVYKEEAVKNHRSVKDLADRFPFHKNTFINHILESLLALREQSLTESKIHRYLESAIILYEKRLHLQAMKVLSRARKEAEQYEKHYLLLEICENERKLLKEIAPIGLEEAMMKNSIEKKMLWRKMENEDAFSVTNDKVFMLYRELSHVKDIKKLDELQVIIENPLLSNEAMAQTFDARLKYHYIYALYYRLKINALKAREHREKIIELWNTSPHMIAEMPSRYRADLSNLLSARHLTKDYTDFEELVNRIENIKTLGNSEDDAAVFRDVYYLRQLYLLNTGNKEKALDLIPEIEQWLKKNEKFIGTSRFLSFCYNIAITYFVNNSFREVLPWIERILIIDKKSKIRKDLFDFANILEIIVQFETGKFELIEYRIRNTRDRLKSQNKLYDFEKIVLQFLGRLVENIDKRKEPEIWKLFLIKLRELSNEPGMENLLGLEEITLWVEAKIKA